LDYNTIILNREHSRFSASKKLTSKRKKERKKERKSKQVSKQVSSYTQ
jgi:hypothetical protein